MTKKLTACRDCKYNDPGGASHIEAECLSKMVPSHFSSWRGESGSGAPLCVQINHAGHCPHFEEKE